MTISDEMYKEHILELYKNPLNFGIIENPTNFHQEINPLCGDKLSVSLIVEDNIVKDIKFNGNGCAISVSSASLITDKVKNMSVKDVLNLKSEDIIKLLEIKIHPARLKCVLLSLEAIKKALQNE